MPPPAPRRRLTLATTIAALFSAALALGSSAPTAHAQRNADTRAGDFSETTSKPTPRSESTQSSKSPAPNEAAANGSQRFLKADGAPANIAQDKGATNEPLAGGSSKKQGEDFSNTFDAFPAAAVKKPIRGRAVSPSVAAQLAARMPKYEEPKPAEPAPEEEPADLRDIDKPQNQILRLPDYVVREKKPAILREGDLYRGDGRAALAKAHYFSETGLALNRFELPLFGGGAGAYALRRYEEDERLRHLGELSATASDIGQLSGSPETEADLRSLIRDTYFRSGTRSDDYNGYRKPD